MKRILIALFLSVVLTGLVSGILWSQERESREGRGREGLRDADLSREDWGELFEDNSRDTRLREDRDREGRDRREERHRRRGRDRDRERREDRREDRTDEPFDDRHPGPGGGE